MKRIVQPFKNAFTDVMLQFVIVDHRGDSEPSSHTRELERWINQGSVKLDVVALWYVLPSETDKVVEYLAKEADASDWHRRLCGLGGAYLMSMKKKFYIGGSSARRYGGGIADVMACDRSIVVECGNLSLTKPRAALMEGRTLVVIPYGESPVTGAELEKGKRELAYIFTPSRPIAAPKSIADHLDPELLFYKGTQAVTLGWVRKQVRLLESRGMTREQAIGSLKRVGVTKDGHLIEVTDI